MEKEEIEKKRIRYHLELADTGVVLYDKDTHWLEVHEDNTANDARQETCKSIGGDIYEQIKDIPGDAFSIIVKVFVTTPKFKP